jgi:hypothetical protein
VRRVRRLVAAAWLLALPACAQQQRHLQQPRHPLDRAHAHNDYEHGRPLLDALERGFGSVEADVYLVNGELLVAHHRDSVRAGRTLEALYLAPLRERLARGGGRVHPGRAPLLLLIDVKSNADSTWPALDATLRRYADLLTVQRGDTVVEGPVLAVISGNRPLAAVRAARERYAALDGRLPDLDDRAGATATPLVSDKWELVTKWTGEGRLPPAARRRLERLVARAHAQGRRIRFWGTPDRESVWRVLRDAGVDLIGSDDLDRLARFLTGG